MPREIIKYLCDFRCGVQAMNKEKQMLAHQAICWGNPDNKSCTTCKHEIYNKETEDYRMIMHRSCEHPEAVEQFDELIVKSDYHNTPMVHALPVRHCPFWESKINLKSA